MEKNEICPRCHEGKLVERTFTEPKIDTGASLLFGVAFGGMVPVSRDVEYIEYTCSMDCGYKERKER